MFETGRRSAISISELGLYSDRGDRYNRSKYGPIVRKFVIVVMAVVAVILAAIFIYDFTSGASATSKVSQETKHIYILQNALKKGSSFSKKASTSTTISPDLEIDESSSGIQDRSDNIDLRQLALIDVPGVTNRSSESRSPRTIDPEAPEVRSQSLQNFKQRKRLLEMMNAKDENSEGKQSFSNHAVVYRVRQRYKYPDPGDELLKGEESRPVPFHFELKTPQPASFNKYPKFPQLTQYRYPHSSRNIQDIIKYLTNDPNAANRGIKFTGVYVNPKKYDVLPETGEMMANSDQNEYQSDDAAEDDYDDASEDFSESSRYTSGANHGDPFYLYKPKHPTDVNLLAPSNVRFSPAGTHRYNPYHDPFFQRPPIGYAKPLAPFQVQESSQLPDNVGAYTGGSYGKKRKPKPFSVMLDIYPITDLNEQPNNKVSRPRPPPPSPPISIEDFDPRRPAIHYGRGQRYPSSQAIPIVAIPAQSGLSEEDERQQMIFHLNLYPRKKNKHSRNDIIQRSETMRPEDHEKFMHSVMSPFEVITKQLADHSTIEESKYEESELPETTTQRPIFPQTEVIKDESGENVFEENSSQEKADYEKFDENKSSDEEIKNSQGGTKNWNGPEKNLDTPEGFQDFADGLIATE